MMGMGCDFNSSSASSFQPATTGLKGGTREGSRTHSRASRYSKRTQRQESLDFVIDIGEFLQSNEKLEPHIEGSPDDFLQDGSKKWQSGDPHHYSIPRKGDSWEECFKQVQKFDEEMCRGWREEIDTLLVFAGLFSAAVTAFTVESYRWLRSEPEDVGAQLLALISSQLNASVNSIKPPAAFDMSTFTPDPSAVRVNIFWFTSLTLSLTAVLVGILCKQWLREYQRYEGLSPKEAFPVRQMRYEGLTNWHVNKFLSFLPLLLQGALLLFFAGLLDLLWSLNPLIASIISSLVGVVMVLLISTTILPFVQHLVHFAKLGATAEPHSQCAFKSPQSRAFHLLGTSVVSLYSQCKLYIFGSTAEHYLRILSWDSDANWVNYDLEWQNHGKYMERGIAWFKKTYARDVDSIYHVFHCLESLNEDVAAGCISEIIMDTWNPLLPLVGLLVPCLKEVEQMPQTDDGEMRLARDLLTMSYSLIYARTDELLLKHCMEVAARIANTKVDVGGGEEADRQFTSLVLEVLTIILPSKNGVVLDDALQLQIMAALTSMLQNDKLDIDSSDVPKFWNIFNNLRQHDYRAGVSASGPGKRLAYDLLKEAELWLSRIMDSEAISIHDKERLVKEFSSGLCSVYWSVRADSEIDIIKSSSEFDVLYEFIRFVDSLLFKFGGALSVMSPWTSEVWDMVKLEFGGVSDATAQADS